MLPADGRLVRAHFSRTLRRSPGAKALEQKNKTKKKNDYSLLNPSGKHRGLPSRGICRSHLWGQRIEAVRHERFISRFTRKKRKKRRKRNARLEKKIHKMTKLTWYDRSFTYFLRLAGNTSWPSRRSSAIAMMILLARTGAPSDHLLHRSITGGNFQRDEHFSLIRPRN